MWALNAIMAFGAAFTMLFFRSQLYSIRKCFRSCHRHISNCKNCDSVDLVICMLPS